MSAYKIEVVPIGRSSPGGEGPHWNAETQELLFVNGLEKSVHRYSPATGQVRKLIIESESGESSIVSFIIPIQSTSNSFIIGCGDSLRILDWPEAAGSGSEIQKMNKAELKTLATIPAHDPPIWFNDGKCDAKGRLWTGTMCFKIAGAGFEILKGVSNLYRLDTDGNFSVEVPGIGLSNGMGWSPDGKRYYYIDSCTNGVDGFDYDLETGAISNRRTVFELKANNIIEGLPDGMCVDANGNLWVAAYDGGRVLNINPVTGKLIQEIKFPTKKITSCAFGGVGLDVLYVTSASLGLSEEEAAAMNAGSLFKVTGLGVKGASAGIAYAYRVC